MPMTATPPWALLLAGGDGRRLKPQTRQIAGDPRPKQFCAIFDGETLLHRTRRRAELFTRADQHVVVVSREHEPYYRELAGELAPDRLVEQPRNAGTAPGIVYSLLRIRELAHDDAPVAIFPSDHYVADDGARDRVRLDRSRPRSAAAAERACISDPALLGKAVGTPGAAALRARRAVEQLRDGGLGRYLPRAHASRDPGSPDRLRPAYAGSRRPAGSGGGRARLRGARVQWLLRACPRAWHGRPSDGAREERGLE